MEILLKKVPATPLDISSVAYFINTNKMNIKEYLSLIFKKGQIKMERIMSSELGDYKGTRETIIATTFDKIIDESESNLELLMMLCLLDSENIDKNILNL